MGTARLPAGAVSRFKSGVKRTALGIQHVVRISAACVCLEIYTL